VKELPYTVREVPLTQAFTAVRKVNPIGKLPCLEHDGRFIGDSTDIAHHLEAQFPEPPLVPRDPKLRGLCHMLEDWADESLYFYEMRLRFTVPHNARKHIPTLTKYDPAWMKTAARFVVPRMMRGVLRGRASAASPHMIVRDLSATRTPSQAGSAPAIGSW
jgi:glutathione S-transferase